jgi:hypothetical protein
MRREAPSSVATLRFDAVRTAHKPGARVACSCSLPPV